jgi:hypothetical protein
MPDERVSRFVVVVVGVEDVEIDGAHRDLRVCLPGTI